MGTKIEEALSGHTLIGLDSCILIYVVEQHAVFGERSRRIIDCVASGQPRAVASTMALLEAITGPYRRGQPAIAREMFSILTQFPNLHWSSVDFAIAHTAAQIRGNYRCSTPDAVHLATAVESGATLFVTNDCDLPAVPGLQCLQLSDYVT